MYKNRLIGLVLYKGKLRRSQYLQLLEDAISNFEDDLPLNDLQNFRFQHDSASPHKVSSFQQYLWNTFQQLITGHSSCMEVFTWPEPIGLFCSGDTSSRECMHPSINIAGTLKLYYWCLSQHVTCHVIQCAARSALLCPDVYYYWKTPFWAWQINAPHFRQVQFSLMWSNQCLFCDFHFCPFCEQDVILQKNDDAEQVCHWRFSRIFHCF